MALVQARGLSKSFSGKAAVRGLSFDVMPGSVTGFLGPNGAGKSTTMRLMLGLDNGEGVTTYDGVPYRELEPAAAACRVGAGRQAVPPHPPSGRPPADAGCVQRHPAPRASPR